MITRNGAPRSLDVFERKYAPLAQEHEDVGRVITWLRALHELTAKHCSDFVITGIAYGKYLQHLEQDRQKNQRRPSIALLFETNLPSMYEAAIGISDKIIAPFFEQFGYFPYFMPLTREELERAREEQPEYYKDAFQASSVTFFSQ